MGPLRSIGTKGMAMAGLALLAGFAAAIAVVGIRGLGAVEDPGLVSVLSEASSQLARIAEQGDAEAEDAAHHAPEAISKAEAMVEASVQALREKMDTAGNARSLIYGLLGLTLVAMAALSVSLRTRRDDNLEAVIRALEAMARGDFTVELKSAGDANQERLARALNASTQRVRKALEQVVDMSSSLTDAARQLTSAGNELTEGAKEQAASLEQTAAALEEMSATIKQTADNARMASQLASGSKEVAEKGGKVVGDAVAAMSAINDSSRQIADIITTIDEIAFQTNLLALNAAVEAARAGDQGRGFAVVASEVRNLAQRSATAAREIKVLIQDSVQKIEGGTGLVNESGEILGEIVASVQRVNDIIAEISAASQEESAGIVELTQATTRVDQVMQTNVRETAEMAGTSARLLEQAEQLSQMMSEFKVGNSPSPRRADPIMAQSTRPTYTEPAPLPGLDAEGSPDAESDDEFAQPLVGLDEAFAAVESSDDAAEWQRPI